MDFKLPQINKMKTIVQAIFSIIIISLFVLLFCLLLSSLYKMSVPQAYRGRNVL